MRKTFLIVLLVLTASTAVAAVAMAPFQAANTSGKLDNGLQRGDFGAPDGAPEIKLGTAVQLTGSIYADDFFDRDVVNMNATIKNTADVPMFFSYHVAVFDAEGRLLGASSQGSFGDEGLEAGEETQLGSILITMPAATLEQVATYQATFYESAEKF
jgi:hypothetical protein